MIRGLLGHKLLCRFLILGLILTTTYTQLSTEAVAETTTPSTQNTTQNIETQDFSKQELQEVLVNIQNAISKLDTRMGSLEKQLETKEAVPLPGKSSDVEKKLKTFTQPKPAQTESKYLTSATTKPQKEELVLKSGKVTVKKETYKSYDVGAIYINDKNVINYRSGDGNLSAYDRAVIVAKRIDKLIANNVDFQNLTPALRGNQYIGTVHKHAIFTVDQTTAKRCGSNPSALTLAWINNIREALGVQKLDRRSNKIASRSLSPGGRAFLRQNVGMASWYGGKFHGRRAADGSVFNKNALTAAHKTLPFGTQVKVTNLRNNQSCIVRITDRGPFIRGRIIDLSKAAAKEIGMLGSGVAKVEIEVVN